MSSKPSIVSSKASLPEVVGEAGVYVDPYNIDDIADAFLILNLTMIGMSVTHKNS